MRIRHLCSTLFAVLLSGHLTLQKHTEVRLLGMWSNFSTSCRKPQAKNYWIDCGRLGKRGGDSDTAAWQRCAKNSSCARRCVKNYFNRYGTYCTGGRRPTCQDYARIHNGGPRGCRISATLGYWRKVQRCL